MELNRHIERSVARHIALTERFYYHPEQRISALAADLGVDRNTVLADIAALTSLLGTSVERQERTRGRVSVRFARNCTLLELIQRVYGESNLLLLCNAYLAHEVDIAAFAGRLGLSISAAYALNRRAVALLTAMGGTVRKCRLIADETRFRYIAILIRTALGFRPPALQAHLVSVNRIISEFERRFGFPLTDLDRSFLRAAMGLTLERGRYALDAWFLEAAADIPAHAFFEFEVDIDGRSVSHEEALFLGAMAACVTAKNRVAGRDALARWIDASPWFARLAESMAERFGAEPCATDLFRASLRRLYLFERIGAAATAFTQDRPVADAYRDVFDDTRTIMDMWKRDLPGPGTEANADLIAQFVLQITPLIDRRPVPPRFLCAVVTLSELNRLTISYAVTRRFSGTGQVVKGAFTDIASACAALDSAKDADAGALTMVIVDREYPTGEPTELEGHRIISASVVSGTDALAERIDRALSGART